MKAKGSSAVMASRASDPPNALDYFPTPPWATRALFPIIREFDAYPGGVWEPACGEGHMASPLGELFGGVLASDIFPYGYGKVHDFLDPVAEFVQLVDWVITNPPFSVAQSFIERALQTARVGVAMLVRLQFLEGELRHRDLFSRTPPSVVALFSERCAMARGRWEPNGSTATANAWLVWIQGRTAPTELRWIPPGRRDLLTTQADIRRFAHLAEAPLLEPAIQPTGKPHADR